MTEYWLHIMLEPELSQIPQSFAFSSELLRDAFLRGVEESAKSVNGAVYFVPHIGFSWVDGKLVEIDKKIRSKASLHERYIFWNDDEMSRTMPETISFRTVDEAACFELGVKASAGHSQVILVPSPQFRFLNLKEVTWLSHEIAEGFQKLLAEHPELEGNIVANELGDWVETDWRFGKEIKKIK